MFFAVDFANQIPELLKMVFDNIIQIHINCKLVDAHNIGNLLNVSWCSYRTKVDLPSLAALFGILKNSPQYFEIF